MVEVYTSVANLKQSPPIFMVLGTFDGVHVGHQDIIRKTVEKATAAHALSAVFTFSDHPLSVIAPHRCPSLLITSEEKIQYLRLLGVDLIFNIPFTRKLLKQTPDEFIRLLTSNLNLRNVVVGSNFTYGFRGGGNPADLKEAGEKYNFSVDICQLVDMVGIHVSSTRIRQLIAGGYVDQAANLLNRPFAVSGKMQKNKFNGRKLGFLRTGVAIPDEFIIPADGMYVVNVKQGEHNYRGWADVGDSVPFNRRHRRIDLLLACLENELHYQDVKVEFINRLRSNSVLYLERKANV